MPTIDVSFSCKFMYDLSWLAQPDDTETLYQLYESLIHRLKGKGMRFVEHIYEKDSNDVLHVHALCRLDKVVYGNYCQAWKTRYQTFGQHGFSIDIQVTQIASWKKYMYKDAATPGKYFKQGTSVSPVRLKTYCHDSSNIYQRCIDNEVAKLQAIQATF